MMSFIDIVHRALVWLLTWEVVGLLAGVLARFGIPPEFTGILVIVAALLLIYKITSDRYMLDRWRRKFYRWRN